MIEIIINSNSMRFMEEYPLTSRIKKAT